MGLLARGSLLAVLCSAAACYAPEVRDCTVKCTAETDCAGDQVCGSESYCVGAAETRCANGAAVADAGVGPNNSSNDAGAVALADAAIDATVLPDAPTQGVVTVSVEGKGSLVLDGIGTCTSGCTYTVPLSVTVTMHAIAGPDFHFDKWLTAACVDDNNSTCAFVPLLTMQVGAKFRKDD